MSTNIVVPELGESVVEARVAKWLKKQGDAVNAGEPLVELETEKIDLEVSADRAGVLGEIKYADGADVKVGEILAVLERHVQEPPLVRIELAFEAVKDVDHVVEAGALQRITGLERAISGPADEDDGALLEVRPGDLLHLPDEVRIQLPVGAVVPRHHHRALGMPDEHVLHLAAAVDEDRVGMGLEELESGLGVQVVHGGIIIPP